MRMNTTEIDRTQNMPRKFLVETHTHAREHHIYK